MCKGSVQHKCLGENENDGWRGVCREVCARVFVWGTVQTPCLAPTHPPPHTPNGNSRSEAVLIFTLSNPIM